MERLGPTLGVFLDDPDFHLSSDVRVQPDRDHELTQVLQRLRQQNSPLLDARSLAASESEISALVTDPYKASASPLCGQ